MLTVENWAAAGDKEKNRNCPSSHGCCLNVSYLSLKKVRLFYTLLYYMLFSTKDCFQSVLHMPRGSQGPYYRSLAVPDMAS